MATRTSRVVVSWQSRSIRHDHRQQVQAPVAREGGGVPVFGLPILTPEGLKDLPGFSVSPGAAVF